MNRQTNPWTALPKAPPYVLPADRLHVEAFNRHVDARHQLDGNLVPQPFLGNPQAPILVLGRNPDIVGGHASGPYADAIRANLELKPGGCSHPALLPRFAQTRNATWWRRCFASIFDLGHVPEEVARRVLSVEFHGYHSERWRLFPTLPSQHFGFSLVEAAMRRGAVIVVMRGRRDWEVAVPGLSDYPSLVVLNNPRTSVISPRNCGPEGFANVLNAFG